MRINNVKPSTLMISIAIVFAIAAIGEIVIQAIDRSPLMLIVLMVAIVAALGLFAWLTSFIVAQRERWARIDLEKTKVENKHESDMAAMGLIREGGNFKPRKQIAAPVTQETQTPSAPIDPRHQLLLALCLKTIRTERVGDNVYGPASVRLMTADDAQAIDVGKGGQFADRTNWSKASEYAQEVHWCWKKQGGKSDEQGLRVDKGKAGGETVADLLEALYKARPVLDSAVFALPGVDR